VKNSSGDAKKFAAAVKKVQEGADLPLILMSDKVANLKEALKVCGDSNPLLYAATKDNVEEMVALAKESHCPLAVAAAPTEGLEALAALVEKVVAAGVKDIVLDPGARQLNHTFSHLILIRRAALKQKFRPLGYPVITFPSEETEDDFLEAAFAGIYVMKYAGIIILRSLEPWKALPLFVLRQNIYTDPQRPMQVEQKIYSVGNPDEKSPVLITTNFSLTYFVV